MRLDRKIAFLGAGNMAGALIRGLLEAGACTPGEILASDVRAERLEELERAHGILTGSDNAGAAAWADVIVLSTKPQVFHELLSEAAAGVRKDALVVSIAAGVPLAAIEARLAAGTRVVRAMPNTPCLVLAGATGIARGAHATADDVALAKRVFDSVGTTVVVGEPLLDAVTGLSGSGPAYVFVIIEALTDAGVRVGLPRDAALLLAAQTVLGSAQLLLETREHPSKLKDMVTSPGGTAIAGVQALEAGGLRAALMAAVESATRRAGELGEQARERLKPP